MKKRVLSLLLVACMLLSMVPVFSSVAVAADAEKADYDYSTLYVTDGLLGLYTAYLGDSSLDLANGKWADISGKGNDATVNGTWTAGTYGGFGYDAATIDTNTNLTFPSTMLPTDEYTLEIVSAVRGVTADGDGATQTNAFNQYAGISLGRLRGFFWCGPKGETGNYAERYMNGLTCFVTEAASAATDQWNKVGSAAATGIGWNNSMTGWRGDTSVVNVTIGLHSTETQYVYTYWKDAVNVTPSVTDYPCASVCGITEGSAYQGQFVLFRGTPASAYAVRLYDDILAADEKAQNHFADVCAFYQLDMTGFDALSADAKQNLYNRFWLISLDAENYDSAKASAQTLMGLSSHEEINYNALYVKNGLVGLYSSFYGDNYINAETGVWADLSGKGNNATLVNIGAWKTTTFGAIGYDAATMALRDSTGTSTVARSLQLPTAFDTDNWTVETFINHRYYLDESGARLEPADGPRGWNAMQSFRFGLLGCFTTSAVMKFRWTYSYWTQGALNSVMGPDVVAQGLWSTSTYKKYYNTGNKDVFLGKDAFLSSVDSVGTFGFTKATADDGTVTWTGYDQIKATQILSLSATRLSELNCTSFTYTDGEGQPQIWEKMTVTPYALHQFTLFNESPVYIYAVRAYDRVLTDAEKNYNYVIDAFAFYGIDLSAFMAATQAVKNAAAAALASTVKGYGMQDGDLAAYIATAKALETALETALEAAMASHAPNAYDLLYVGMDGSETANGGKLMLYLSAMAGTNSTNMSKNVWYDKALAHDGTFKNYAGNGSITPAITWATNRDGKNGVGYDVLGGWQKADGTYDTSKDYTVNAAANVYLQLDKTFWKDMNDSNFTMDYVVNYHTIQWYDASGNLHVNEPYNVSTVQTNMADMIGVLRACYQRGNVKGGMNFAREVRWWLSEGTTGFGSAWGKNTVNNYQNSDIWRDESRETSNIYTQSITRAWNTEVITFDTYILYNGDAKVAEYSLNMLSAYSASATLDTTKNAEGEANTKYYVVLSADEKVYELRKADGTAVYTNLWTGVFTDLAAVVTADTANPIYLTVDSGSQTTRSVKYVIGHNMTGANFVEGIRNTTYYENYIYAKPYGVANQLQAQTKNPFYISDAKAADFYMFKQSPVTVYSIRLYDAVLTEDEKLQNHFADIAAYYELDVADFNKLSDEDKLYVYEAFADEKVGYVVDAQKKLDALVDANTMNEYDMLFVGADGSMTANGGKLLFLYTAYKGTGSAVVEEGIWFDKLGRNDAIFYNGKTGGTHNPVWESRGENGVGYDVYGGQVKADGTLSKETYFSFAPHSSIYIDASWEASWGTRLDLPLDVLLSLNDGDYTLDYVSKYGKIKVRNTDDTEDLYINDFSSFMLGYRHFNLGIGSLVVGVSLGGHTDYGGVNWARWAYVKTGWDTGSYNNQQMYRESKTYTTYDKIVTNTLTRVRTNGVSFAVYAFYEVDAEGNIVGDAPIGMVSESTWDNAYVRNPELRTNEAAGVVYTMTSEAIADTTDVRYIFTAVKSGEALAVYANEVNNRLNNADYGFRSNIYKEHFGDMLGKNFVVVKETRTTDKLVTTVYGNGVKNTGATHYTDSWATTSTSATFASYSHLSRNLYYEDASYGKFSLFNLYPTTVYTVRMYDVALTAEENAQNHFADLCAYYGVDVALFASATDEQKAAVYASVAELTFLEENDAEYISTKAKIQAAIDSTKATAFEAGETLPGTMKGVEDRVVAVWTTLNGNKRFLPGTVLAEGATLVPVLVHKGETVNGADVNLAVGGLRFKGTFSASDYYTLGKVMGNENASLSMIIAPELYVEKLANGVFTKKALGAGNYVEVAIGGYYDLDGDTYVLAGGLKEFTDVTKENDLAFAAVLCLTVTVGDERYEIYGDYNAETNRSGLDVLTPYAEKIVAGEQKVDSDLADDLLALYTGFAKHDPDLAAALKNKLGLK